MQEQQQRLEEVKSFFLNEDYFLAFRRLLDCVMDSQDLNLYRKAIGLTEAKDKNVGTTSKEWVENCLQLLDETSKIPLQSLAKEGSVIQGDNLCKRFARGGFSLGPVSLSLKKGQVYGLVGENGNGKTTLLRILAKELSADSGLLTFKFEKAAKDDYDLRTKLVYIPQRTQKWHGSLQDNLKFVLANYGIPPEEVETRMLIMIARLGLWNYKDLQWSELSSGYKMRFELARTLLRQPEVLLLDEPLANLDVLAQQVILEDLRFIANSITKPMALLLSSQQLYEVEKVSDKVLFLKNGKYDHALQENNPDVPKKLVIEMDIMGDKTQLRVIFANLNLENMSFNGGQYIVEFDEQTSFSSVLLAIAQSEIELLYIRNISSSSRRFFVA